MTTSTVLTEIRGHTAVVTLNKPALHNAFDDELIHHLTETLRRMEAHAGVRMVVLAAQGKSFSAGADLNWMKRMAGYSFEENLADARKLAQLMGTLNGLSKPTVGKIQGAAFGGGVGLVACCDIAIAASSASFCLSETRLGLIPAVISPYVSAAIGERQARRYFVTAERFDAGEARRIGLVHEVVEPDQLDGRVEEILQVMAANGPQAMAAAKDLARVVGQAPIDATLVEETARRIATIRAGDEGREGVSAFLDKRKPAWTEKP
ncbi:MAG: enoyl-CoA hydratase/isomerase family protein [Candidatus Competibacteraceae bacterium]|nr:enoyl-CoA hydratase/isomerase family protein [Candidatus Competibacteraceae bacterium]